MNVSPAFVLVLVIAWLSVVIGFWLNRKWYREGVNEIERISPDTLPS